MSIFTKVAIVDGSAAGAPSISTSSVGADGTSNTSTRLPTSSHLKVFNGATWDRVRTAVSDAMAATGLLATGLMGWNGTTWDRLRATAGVLQVSGSITSSPAASELHLGQVGGHTPTLAVEKTRPADTNAYAINDIINESTSASTPWTFAIARTGGPGSGVIIGLLLQTDQAACVAQCEVDVLNAAPAVSVNDNAECTHLYANAGKRLQTVLMPALAKKTTNSDMADAYTPCSVPFKAADNINVYFRLRTLTAFTPASAQKFMITAMYAQD